MIKVAAYQDIHQCWKGMFILGIFYVFKKYFSRLFFVISIVTYLFLYEYIYFLFIFARRIKAQPIPPELAAKLLGNRVAVSPIVTVEPRRRKFHKPISLTIPVPTAAGKGMINQYNNSDGTPTLRLLCSITGNLMFYKKIIPHSMFI